ncbi:hypothetical protein ACF08N_21340 [Streptomyces sp. NPDC015127]|uniref:hypothetical protein n=1 Tax=Streptomyces sp. NPDC015127 TaxID=3364939 RepID=UPI0037011AD3
MIRHTVRALCAASLVIAPLALSTPAHAVTCTVNGRTVTSQNVDGTPGSDLIRCASVPEGHSVNGLGGNDRITITNTVSGVVEGNAGYDYVTVGGEVTSTGRIRGNAGSDYLQVNVNNGVVNGGDGSDYCQVGSGTGTVVNCEA